MAYGDTLHAEEGRLAWSVQSEHLNLIRMMNGSKFEQPKNPNEEKHPSAGAFTVEYCSFTVPRGLRILLVLHKKYKES